MNEYNYENITIPHAFTALHTGSHFITELQTNHQSLYENLTNAYFRLLKVGYGKIRAEEIDKILKNKPYRKSQQNEENFFFLMAYYLHTEKEKDLETIITELSQYNIQQLTSLLLPIYKSINEVFQTQTNERKSIARKYQVIDTLCATTNLKGKNNTSKYQQTVAERLGASDSIFIFFGSAYKTNTGLSLLPTSLANPIILSDETLLPDTHYLVRLFLYNGLSEYKEMSNSRLYTLLQRTKKHHNSLKTLIKDHNIKKNYPIEVVEECFEDQLSTLENIQTEFIQKHRRSFTQRQNTIQLSKHTEKVINTFKENTQFNYIANIYPNWGTMSPSEIIKLYFSHGYHKLSSDLAQAFGMVYNDALQDWVDTIIKTLPGNNVEYDLSICINYLLQKTLHYFSPKGRGPQLASKYVTDPSWIPMYEIIGAINDISINIVAYLDQISGTITYHIGHEFFPKGVYFLEVIVKKKDDECVEITSKLGTYFTFNKSILPQNLENLPPETHSIVFHHLLYNLLKNKQEVRKAEKNEPKITVDRLVYPYPSYDNEEIQITFDKKLVSTKHEGVATANNKESFLSFDKDQIFSFRNNLHKKKLLDTRVKYAHQQGFLNDTYHLRTERMGTTLDSYCRGTSRFQCITYKGQHYIVGYAESYYIYRLFYELGVIQGVRSAMKGAQIDNDIVITRFIEQLREIHKPLIDNLESIITHYTKKSMIGE